MAPLVKSGQPTLPPLSRLMFAAATILLQWETRRATRAGLARLDDHLLDDIGLSARARADECAKQFWQD